MRGGNGGESLPSLSEAWNMRCETCLDAFLFPVRRGGGVAESLSEFRRRVACLESPRPLEGSSRRLGCVRSIEWSLEESDRLALDDAVGRNVRRIHLFAGGWSEVSLIREHKELMSRVMSSFRRHRPSEARVMASRKVQVAI